MHRISRDNNEINVLKVRCLTSALGQLKIGNNNSLEKVDPSLTRGKGEYTMFDAKLKSKLIEFIVSRKSLR